MAERVVTRPDLPPPSGRDVLDELAATLDARPLGGNEPRVLTPDTGLLATRGSLILFLRAGGDGIPGGGRRHYLATVPTGTLVWADASVTPAGWQLLAVGGPETTVVEIPAERLRGDPLAEVVAEHRTRVARDVAGHEATAGEPDLAAALAAAAARARSSVTTEPHRLATGTAGQQAALDRALHGLVRVMEPGGAPRTVPADQRDRLESALAEIGTHLGVEIPPVDRTGALPVDLVPSRFRAARLRHRIVTLEQDWWRRPGSPLLAFADGGTTPVALVPRRRRYVLRDPRDGIRREVDAAVAADLAATAYAVCAPFPEQANARGIARAALRTVRGDLVLLLAFGLLAGLVNLLTPMVVSVVFSGVLPTGNSPLLGAATALLGGAALTLALVTFTQNLVTVRISGRLAVELEPALVDRLLRLPADFFRRYDTGDLATRAIALQQIRQLLSGSVLSSLLALVFSVVSVGVVFLYSPPLALLSLALIVVALAVLVLLNTKVVRHDAVSLEEQGALSAMLYQAARAVPKIRVAGAEARIMARWAEGYRRQQEANYHAGRAQVWIAGITASLPAAVALLLYGAVSAGVAGDVSSGRFLGLFTALGQFTGALTALVFTLGPLLAVVPLWRRMRVVLDEPAEASGAEDPGVLTGRISVRNVAFSYDEGPPDADGAEGTQVLTDVSLDIEPGQFVAIVGPSGSGKSTLMRLLIGLDTPTSGVVLYDGKDLRALDSAAVRRQFGVVLQNAAPLPGAILTTIVGDSGATEADAWRAAEAADLARDIRRMPMRMQTIVGEGGLAFSGGQVQRMMIARALVRRPRILFFDEATSALDDTTQSVVSRRIEEMAVTRVVVAHRLSTIRNADRIHVIEDGRVAESGTFEELMAQQGSFYRLASRQLVGSTTPSENPPLQTGEPS